MKCDVCERLIPLYREGTLPRRKRRVCEEHLAACSRCAGMLAAYDRAAARLREVPEPELPEGYLERLRRRLDAAAPVRTGWSVPDWVFAPVLGMLLCAIGAGLLVTRRWGRPQEVATEVVQPQPEPVTSVPAAPAAGVKVARSDPRRPRSSRSVPAVKPDRGPQQEGWTVESREVALAKYRPDEPRPMVLRGSAQRIPRTRVVKQWQDAVSGIREREVVLVRSHEEWERLWRRHTAGVQPQPDLPEVNFNREMVIAVFMGERPSDGYGVQVAAVEETPDTVYVQVEERFPAGGAKRAAVPVSPYHIVVVATR